MAVEGPANRRSSACLDALLADAGGLADAIAQVVQLRATHLTVTHDLKPRDLGAVKGEGPLDAHAEAELAHREGLTRTGAAHANDVALEHLLTLTLSLANAIVYTRI